MDDRICEFTEGIAQRLSREPDLDDFLLWNAGTLEYWVHIVASSVGRRLGWSSETEVPYITDCPSPRAKSDTKWADGVCILAGDLGVLLEVKTIPMRQAIGPTITKVPSDFAALVSIDWKRTLDQSPDKYAGEIWIQRRREMKSVIGLQLALVHGRTPLGDVHTGVDQGIARGLATVTSRDRRQAQPSWLSALGKAFSEPPARFELHGSIASGVLYA
jgi:hypothetical protein